MSHIPPTIITNLLLHQINFISISHHMCSIAPLLLQLLDDDTDRSSFLCQPFIKCNKPPSFQCVSSYITLCLYIPSTGAIAMMLLTIHLSFMCSVWLWHIPLISLI
jgi:hypothetical protein